MDSLRKYQQAKALAETNYRTRLIEAQRLMGEATMIYEQDMKNANEEFKKSRKVDEN